MGFGPGLGYSLAILKTFLFCKFKFGNLFLKKNGDDRLDKIFSDNFYKNKIGFNKIIFVAKNMQCDDADVMLMQKIK